MRRSLVLVSVFTVAAVPAAGGQVAAIPEQYLIPKAAQAIQIDGKLDDWNMETPYVITATGDDPRLVPLVGVENPVKSDADLSGRAALAWDEQCLYVAGQMRDDRLLGVRTDSVGNQGPPGWGCDSLMITVASFRQTLRGNSPSNPGRPMLALRYAPP